MVALPDLVLAAGSPCPSFLFQLCFLARMAMVWVSWPFLKETLSYNGCLGIFVFMDVLPVLSSQLQLQTHMILEAAYSLSWLPIFVATSQHPITWQAQQPHNALEATTLQLPFAAADDATWLHYRSPLGCVKQVWAGPYHWHRLHVAHPSVVCPAPHWPVAQHPAAY
ncbi:hypothetical protein HaLaN_23549, partial [Haematococcus lacustris]